MQLNSQVQISSHAASTAQGADHLDKVDQNYIAFQDESSYISNIGNLSLVDDANKSKIDHHKLTPVANTNGSMSAHSGLDGQTNIS